MSKMPYGVLILHGFASSLDSVRAIEPALSGLGLTDRMPALRGHEKESPAALRGVTWQDWLADATTAFESLANEVDKVFVIGHSMGGLLALNLAMSHGDQIESIILAAAAIQLTLPFSPGKPLYFLVPAIEALIKKIDLPPEYSDPDRVPFDTNYHWAPTEATVTFLKLVEHTRQSLGKVKTPALIIQSHRDATVDRKGAEIIYQRISTPPEQKKIVWFDKTGHEMFQDCERSEVIEVIKDYVQERMNKK